MLQAVRFVRTPTPCRRCAAPPLRIHNSNEPHTGEQVFAEFTPQFLCRVSLSVDLHGQSKRDSSNRYQYLGLNSCCLHVTMYSCSFSGDVWYGSTTKRTQGSPGIPSSVGLGRRTH